MRPTDLEALIPGLKEARATEHLNRSLCFAGITWTVSGFEIVALTPRHKLELSLAGCAFFTGSRIPEHADVFKLLWRMHPKFARSSFALPVIWAKARLRRKIKVMGRGEALNAALAISDYLQAMAQDMPEGDSRAPGLIPENYVHWMAAEMAFYLRTYPGFTMQSYMDTPYLILQQLYRAWKTSQEEHPNFVNKSDQILGLWQRAQLGGKPAQP